ncbi:MAG: RidA family protein [Bacteroidetes bacterium]|nr:RidA family protein [Bacteroidota bacterium]
MKRTLISSGSEFEMKIGYSRAVVDGRWVFVSGTTGYNYSSMEIPASIEAQTINCIKNINGALQKAGALPEDIVRVRYILPDAMEFPKVWSLLKDWLAGAMPAATMMAAGLANPLMKIEIEVTALKRNE